MERKLRERIVTRLTLERQKADRIIRSQKEKEDDRLFYEKVINFITVKVLSFTIYLYLFCSK